MTATLCAECGEPTAGGCVCAGFVGTDEDNGERWGIPPVCGNCGGAGVEYRRADDEPDHDHAWLPCSGCQHDQDPPAKPAAFGVVNVNHGGREWTVSYERPATGAGPDYRLTAWCRQPFHREWLETLNVYGVGDVVDPVGEAIAWVQRLASNGYLPGD